MLARTVSGYFRRILVSLVFVIAWSAYIGGCETTARADEPSPTTAYDVTCKDGHRANHVLGDAQAPCRRHGGAVKIIATDDYAAQQTMIVEPISDAKDDSDEMRRIAVCNDGAEFWANSKTHKGACKGHDGVKSWDDGTKVKVKRAEHRTPRKVAVKDAKS